LRSDLVAALPLAQEIFTSSTPPEAHPEREATIVTIGIHPFVVGSADGAEALRRVLENFRNQKLVWVTDAQSGTRRCRREEVANRPAVESAGTGTAGIEEFHARIDISSHLCSRSINVIFLSS
jgi:hypothetical protein